ncbi:hypothetical protein QA612_17810 [Evansella sp. AB-P1]|uniref:hypothetical protein n=1 Tax=Evansella sp. AB-P1 TaxID=3037653 RepID=UPI00241E9F53|nr:hypothetical protein [Evansella sp. AB-P1]MDG5789320.1 hypothetical protein [Evansella sp. AB-P1]
MRITKIHKIFIFLIIIGLGVATYFSIAQYQSSPELDVPSFTVSFLSLSIALLAFYIALETFSSIDSVNKITKMEGNILENESYVISLPSLIKDFDDKDLNKTEEKIFSDLEKRFKRKSKTAVEFADNLQHFIDLIVLFPALFNVNRKDHHEYQKKMDNILRLIRKREKELLFINTGNLILIQETVKLIHAIMSYQKLTHEQTLKHDSDLFEVRGMILKNSVTRTVYYNYLGLLYNKKAMAVLKKNLQLPDADLLQIDQLKEIIAQKDKLIGKEREIAILFLQESKNAFQKALSTSQEDVMWLGFILYNDARTTFFLQLLTEDTSDTSDSNNTWLTIMKKAIDSRTKLNIIISEVVKSNGGSTCLQSHFLYQEEMARLVQVNILIAEYGSNSESTSMKEIIYRGMDITKISNPVSLEKLFFTEINVDKIAKYQQTIQGHLFNKEKDG